MSFYKTNLLAHVANKNVVYIAYVGKHGKNDTFKYGKSSDIYQREYTAHRKAFPIFDMIHIYPTNFNDYVETSFEKELKIRKIHTELVVNHKRQTELFQPNEDYPLESIDEMMKKIIKQHEMEDTMLQKLNAERIKLEKLKVRLAIKEVEYKILATKFLSQNK